MNENNPIRWREPGSGAPEGLQDLLASAAADEASPTRLAGFIARVDGAVASSGAGSTGSGGGVSSGKVVAGLAVLAAGGALVWMLARPGDASSAHARAPRPPDEAAQSRLSPRTAVASAPAPARTSAPAETTPPTPGTAEPSEITWVSVPDVVRRPSAEPGADSLAAEVRLLQAAREALAGTPAETYRLAEQHRSRFPHGALAQEREVLAIEALLRQGRQSQAQERADRFRQAYPRSGHLDRLTELRDNRGQ